MTTLRDFKERFAFFQDRKEKFLKNDLSPNDHMSPYFIKYFTSLGFFIEKIHDSISTLSFDKLN